MALIKSDRVKETSTSTGATTFALAGAGTGYRTFSSVCAIGDTFYYAISNQSNGEWEAGLGTYSALNTLTRTAVHSSSNSGNVVTFTSGTKEVFLTLTARHLDRINDNGQSTAIGSKTSVVAVNDSATLPDLDLQFADLKTLTAKYGPTPSYSRASTGTYFNASGVLTSAAVNEARFDHVYDGTTWISKGLLIEEQRTNICTYSSNQLNAAWVPFNSTITASGETDPVGGTSAFRIAETTTSNQRHMAYSTITPSASTFTYSVFAKAQERNWLQLISFDDPNLYYTWFNLSTGVVGTNAAGNTATITAVGNGWYRCSVTRTVASTGAQYIQTGPANGDNNSAYAGDPTKGLLVYGAQVEIGAFPTSYIPTVASSVTRSADVCQITGSAFTNLWNATEGSFAVDWDARRNSTGQFTVYWARDSASNNTVLHTGREALSPPGVRFSVVSGSSVSAEIINAGFPEPGVQTRTAGCYKANDFAYAYNGTLIGTDNSGAVPLSPTDLLIGYDPYGSLLNGHIARLRYFRSRLDNTQLVNLSGGINTLAFKPVTGSGSVTVANEYSGINISVPNPLPITNGGTGGTTAVSAAVNLIKSAPNDGAEYTLKSKQISGAPSFYWVDSTGYAPTLDLLFAADKSLTAYTGPTPSFSRASTGTFFNSSGVLTTAAVNGPRFNHVYNGSSWVSKGLLVEEQRTNLFNNSVNLFTGWTVGGFTTDSNKTLAPDALTLVDKLIPETGNTDAKTYKVTSITNGLSYSYSVYIKKSELYRARLQFYDGGFYSTIFDVNSGTIISTTGGLTSEISNAGNGWYRCTVKRVSALTGSGFFYVLPENATPGNGTSGFYAWGAQLEAGSFPTSYIPTTTAAVTRSADVCQITGGDFSGFWNASEGSVAAEYDRLFSASSITNASTVFQAFIDGSNNDRYALFHNSSGTVGERFNVTVGNIEYANLDSGLSISQTSGRSSTAYKVNDFALSVNGGAIVSDTSGSIVSSANKLNIGQMYGSNWLNGHIARLRYYPTRLSNATLQVLST